MNELTGTVALTRFVLRRDRLRIVVWVTAIVVLLVLSAASVKGLYPSQADLDEAAAANHDNAAAIAINGPDQALDTLGGQVAYQIGTFGLIAVALMSAFMTGRETRAEEEAGRLEMIRSMAVGRHAATGASLIVVIAMNVVVGALVTLGLVGLDLPTTGAVVFGASLVALGLVFAGVANFAAQITENARVVNGISGSVLGTAFVLRAAGDIGDGTLSWFSPIGWSQKTRPFAGERWWPLLVAVASILGLLAAAAALESRRDVGAGIIRSRLGPPNAAPHLGRPVGLAVRLQRGSVVGWSVGLFLLGAVYGAIADNVDEFVGDNEAVMDVLAPSGSASLTDSYLSRAILIAALIGAGFAASSALRMRTEETGLHAEAVLATPISRVRWVLSQLVVTAAGTMIVLAAAGLGTGLAYAIVGGGAGQVPRLTGAALAYTPAVLLLVGVVTALFGLAPRRVHLAWAVLAVWFVVGVLSEILGLPAWLRAVSPFHHIPPLPAADFGIVPLVVVSALAATLTVAGLAGFRHRDVS